MGLRSDVNNPNTWSTIGGGIESGETILDCLKREIKEELGIELNTKLIPLDDNGFYKTFISWKYLHTIMPDLSVFVDIISTICWYISCHNNFELQPNNDISIS